MATAPVELSARNPLQRRTKGTPFVAELCAKPGYERLGCFRSWWSHTMEHDPLHEAGYKTRLAE